MAQPRGLHGAGNTHRPLGAKLEDETMRETFHPQLSPRFAALAGAGQRWRRQGGYGETTGPRLCQRLFQLRASAEQEISESKIGTLIELNGDAWERIA